MAEESMALGVSFEEAKKTQTDMFDPVIWTQMKGMSETFRASGGLPAGLNTVPKIMLVMQAGREMGMAPVESTQDLYPVNGAVNIWGKAISKRLRKFGWEIDYKDEILTKDKEEITAVVWRWVKNPSDGKFEKREHTQRYTFEMAKDSGHTMANGSLKVGWKPGSNRLNKLRYGALNMIIKTRLGDVLGAANGIVEAEEDIIEALPPATPGAEPAAELPPSTPVKGTATNINDFLAKNKASKFPKKLHVEPMLPDSQVEEGEFEPPTAEQASEGLKNMKENSGVPLADIVGDDPKTTDLNKMKLSDVVYSTKKNKREDPA